MRSEQDSDAPVVNVSFSLAARIVHAVPLPIDDDGSELTASCGARLPRDLIETLQPGQGMPCVCLACSPTHLRELPAATPPTPTDARIDYQALGWPVITHGKHVLLTLGQHATAVAFPVALAKRVHKVLAARLRPAPTLIDPRTPDYWIMLAGESFGAAPPWPPDVHVVTGRLPLPPTTTPHGPITWKHPLGAVPLESHREIDLFGALRTVRKDRL